MIIDFRQGIIAYPSSGSLQRFLEFSAGYVSLNTTDGRVDVALANGSENYLLTEASDVSNAWGPIVPDVDAWLYWTLDALTGARTFGITYIQPTYGPTEPTNPTNDLHWFDTTANVMKIYRSGKWVTKIRAFACKINNANITPLGSGIAGKPFAGTQVGIVGAGVAVGRIIVDSQGQPIRRNNGELFTTEDEFFVNGSPVNTIRLEANVFQAEAVENIARYQPVKFVGFGKIALASYNDIQTTAIAMAMEDMLAGEVGTLCMQGVVTNPEWNWPTVGQELWVHGSLPGVLVATDPHVTAAGTYKQGKPAVARVITPTSIFFDQGMGGKGDKGDQGDANVPLATTTIFGISKLSVDAADAANPIVVGDNDPRNFNDRYPLPHNQAATTITTTPTGILTGANLQTNLQIINNSFVKKTGDDMSGYLTLSADPAQDLHAATKHYVDTRPLNSLSDVTTTAPANKDVLMFNGTEWVNGTVDGSLWKITQYETNIVPPSISISLNGTTLIPA